MIAIPPGLYPIYVCRAEMDTLRRGLLLLIEHGVFTPKQRESLTLGEIEHDQRQKDRAKSMIDELEYVLQEIYVKEWTKT